VVVRNEIAPGPPQDRKLERAQEVQDVKPETTVVAQGRALLEQAAVYAAAEVLNETPEDKPVELP
jgi:hypothetical protein